MFASGLGLLLISAYGALTHHAALGLLGGAAVALLWVWRYAYSQVGVGPDWLAVRYPIGPLQWVDLSALTDVAFRPATMENPSKFVFRDDGGRILPVEGEALDDPIIHAALCAAIPGHSMARFDAQSRMFLQRQLHRTGR